MPQEEKSGLQIVLDGARRDLFLDTQSRLDKSLKSNEHLIRIGCAFVMFMFGFVIIVIHYLLVFMRGAVAAWDKEELLLVLILIGGSIGVVFTKTLLAILDVVWPFQKRK